MTDRPVKIDWTILSLMVIFHALAISALFLPSMGGLIAFLIMYAVTVLGITVGFHRLYTHHGFKAKPWVKRTLAVMGTLALEGSIIEWVGHHRMHHNGSDTDKDPHNARKGFWYSHFLWMMRIDPVFDNKTIIKRLTKDVSSDPFLVFLSKPSVFISMQVIFGVALLAMFGLSVMLWGIFLRLVVVYHVTWFVNSACHKWGYKNYEVGDLATNCWWVALLSFGEGWHNNHHAKESYARHGHRFWEIDISWYFIKTLRLFGLIWDVKEPSSGKEASAASSASSKPAHLLATDFPR